MWPDPLIPKVDAFYGETRNALPAQIPASETQGFWIELLIPDDQPAGTYAGNVTVTMNGQSPVPIAVSIQVRAFSLPSTSSLGSAYGFDWDGPCVGHFGGYGVAELRRPQLEALNALYFQDALNHRLTISELVYAPPITNGMGDFTTFDTLYGPFLDGTVLTGPNKLTGAKITAIAYTGDQRRRELRRVGHALQGQGLVRSRLRLHVRRAPERLQLDGHPDARGHRPRGRSGLSHADDDDDSGRASEQRALVARHPRADHQRDVRHGRRSVSGQSTRRTTTRSCRERTRSSGCTNRASPRARAATATVQG